MGGKSKKKGQSAADKQQDAITKYGNEPAPGASDEDTLGMFTALLNMVSQQTPIAPEITPAPSVYREADVDWKKKQTQLAGKARADFKTDQRRKKGRTSTIATSPLLDSTDTETTKSLVTGS